MKIAKRCCGSEFSHVCLKGMQAPSTAHVLPYFAAACNWRLAPVFWNLQHQKKHMVVSAKSDVAAQRYDNGSMSVHDMSPYLHMSCTWYSGVMTHEPWMLSYLQPLICAQAADIFRASGGTCKTKEHNIMWKRKCLQITCCAALLLQRLLLFHVPCSACPCHI
jgi:hypothetical protein